ncbi:type I methionyl aminopeptidase [Elusimicrobiota bacterium]
MISSNKDLQFFSNKQRRIELKSKSEIEVLRKAGQSAAKVLQILKNSLEPGISTKKIDDIAHKEISSLGMKPAFLGYRGYPATACISINNELVHGIPSEKRIIKEGDIVSIDLGLICNGFYGDTAATFGVGKISSEAARLLETTKKSLDIAIKHTKKGNRLGDLSSSIQSFVEKTGYSVVRDYVGHGIGRSLHEEPAIPNFGEPNTGVRFDVGLVVAIEPMVNIGSWKVKTLNDGWTVVTEDGKLCAHFEHMVAITEKGTEVLTKI